MFIWIKAAITFVEYISNGWEYEAGYPATDETYEDGMCGIGVFEDEEEFLKGKV